MKTKVYLSGPITNQPDHMKRFNEAQTALEKEGYSVINPSLIASCLPEDTEYEDYMKLDMVLLDMCDEIYMLKGWKNSCGANREYGYAQAKGMVIICQP